MLTRLLTVLLLCTFACPAPLAAATELDRELAAGESAAVGPMRKWQKLTLYFAGPQLSEDAEPNPFRDYRLDVTFTHGDRSLVVPGFYAADGRAGRSGAAKGNIWAVRFTPDAAGEWRWKASFRKGKDIAIADDATSGGTSGGGGESAGHFDGATGRFEIKPVGENARGFHARGRLDHRGHYLVFAETGEPFLKGGADSPENFLGYADFDGTYRIGKLQPRKGENFAEDLHQYKPHVRDWKQGDPTWGDGEKGKGMIGALNYLAAQGMNSVYFLTMNVAGDGKDVWPWTSHEERFRFDCSKLDQWEIVFDHMDRLGIMLHVITQEQENDQLLDGGDLGPQRRLYYRELIARFGQHPALVWNLGEENTNTDAQRKAFCDYIRRLDSSGHPIVCHTFPGKYDEVYNPLLGHATFDGPSLQTNDTHDQTLRWRHRSGATDHPWFVCLDEIGPANTGVKPDADDPDHDEVRQKHLWGNLMAGGAGVEWYFGYRFAHNDLNLEDWRSRQNMWDQTRHALVFFQKHLPFTQMMPADALIDAKDGYCFAKPGEVYAVYLPRGGSAKLNLGEMNASFDVHWYNPRTGGELVRGSVQKINGPGEVSIGDPPKDKGKDWAAVIKVSRAAADAHKLNVQGGVGGGSYPAGAAVLIVAVEPAGKSFAAWAPAAAATPRQAVRVHGRDRATAIVIMPAAAAAIAAAFRDGGRSADAGSAPDPNARVTSLTLINADTGKPVPGFDPIPADAVLDLSKLPTRNLSIRANVAGGDAAVRFELDGEAVQTERVPPYALSGDTNGDYNAWTPDPGRHELIAVIIGGKGEGSRMKLVFTVK